MSNTISTFTNRQRVLNATMQDYLRSATVADAICNVDTSGDKVIQNPYGSDPSVTEQAIAGTYSVADFTTTDESLTVDREIIVSEHIKDHENVFARFDLFMERTRLMREKAKDKLDSSVLRALVTAAAANSKTITVGATGANFTSTAMATFLRGLNTKWAGYSDAMNGIYVVLENTDLDALQQLQQGSGFSLADAALRNGWITNYMGVDIFVVRSGQFASNTRLAGVKKTATYAMPVAWRYDEKKVSGKTGLEVEMHGYYGTKVWELKKDLTYKVDCTAA